MTISPDEFGAAFKGFMDRMSAEAPPGEAMFERRLTEHFNEPAHRLPTLSESFRSLDHADVQMAMEEEFAGADEPPFTCGVAGFPSYKSVRLASLVAPLRRGRMGDDLSEGPVEYVNIRLDGERVMACVQSGLFFYRRDGEPLAILMTGPSGEFRSNDRVQLEVMARRREVAEQVLGRIRASMRKRSVYRGRMISLVERRLDEPTIRFHALPEITRENIILPPGLLDRVERLTVRFSALAHELHSAGRHLKRGVLLHGPPGTGKTLTAMYVARAIRDRTVILLTGRGQAMIEQSCILARALQPSIVILEDVDLVAEERGKRMASPLLIELLNQMDGLADDADVLFLLTTNRPEILEPALAARPGRVDQAIEIPLPDAACRRRLFELYAQKLALGAVDWSHFIDRTEGASGAFIRELLRKAALFAADEPSQTVEHRHLNQALHELVVEGGLLTQKVLGFAAAAAT
jgi:hypothetical protein